MGQPIIVGDIGGTNVRFAIATAQIGKPKKLHHIWGALSQEYETFGDALASFVSQFNEAAALKRAIFAIAGPVDSDNVKLTNNHWVMQHSEIVRRFGFEDLIFMNDFAAMARSIPELPDKAFIDLQKGALNLDSGLLDVRVVAGAGTGLGQAILKRTKKSDWEVLPTEGGHQSFAPITDNDIQIFQALRHKNAHVSYENICSGAGLLLLYETFCDLAGQTFHPLAPKDITALAQQGDALCAATCEFASDALMSFMSHAVLASGAWNGAVIAGGVSKHLAPYLKRPEALARFVGHGKMSARLKNVPLKLLIDPTAPLIGAASSNH